MRAFGVRLVFMCLFVLARCSDRESQFLDAFAFLRVEAAMIKSHAKPDLKWIENHAKRVELFTSSFTDTMCATNRIEASADSAVNKLGSKEQGAEQTQEPQAPQVSQAHQAPREPQSDQGLQPKQISDAPKPHAALSLPGALLASLFIWLPITGFLRCCCARKRRAGM